MKTQLLIILIIFVAAFSYAQSDIELAAQEYTRYESSDKAMNQTYQKLMHILNDEGKKRLKSSQCAWITFRDAQASFDSHHLYEGKAENIERIGSLNLLTQARTKLLLSDYKRFVDMY